MADSALRISDLCDRIVESVNPRDRPDSIYLGLEHVPSGRLLPAAPGRASSVRSTTSAFRTGDVLYGKLRPYLDKAVLAPSDGIGTTELLVLRPKAGIDPRFLVAVLHAPTFLEYAISGTTGSQHPRTSWAHVSAFPLPNFPPRSRRAITDLAWLVHDAIAAVEAAVTAGTALRAEAMRTLFARGLRDEPTKETENGPMPRSWRLSNIGALFKIEQGLSLKGNLSTGDDGTPFLRTSNVYWGRLDLRSISRMRLSEGAPATKELRPGDLLVCEGGDIGRAAVWNGELKGCVFQNHLHRLRPLPSASGDAVRPHFVRAWLEEGFVNRNAYEGAGNRTTIPNLSRSRLADLAVPDPPLDEQREIVAILDAIARKIGLHRRKLAVLEQLFRTLLHDLMTGRIRADDIDLPNLGTSVDVGGIQGTRE